MRRINFCLLCLLLFSAGAAWADVVIIANQDVPESSISAKELQEIFLGKRVQWRNNSTVHPVVMNNDALHKDFLKQYVKKSSSQWLAHWKRMVFTGKGTPPDQFSTPRELLDYVTKTAGAIGYVDAETAVENVTILTIK